MPKHEGCREVVGEWHPGPRREQSLFENSRARFLQVERTIGEASAWSDEAPGMLWLYNLHYFDDLMCSTEEAPARRKLQEQWLAQWILQNGQGSKPGWDPYPTALRLVNWVRASLEGFELSAAAVDSLALQAQHLAARLEYHLLANHLWADAKGLIFAGLFLQGAAADRWFKLGMRLAEQELREQFLSDGGHFELSPMYTGVMHEDLLDLIQVLRIYDQPVPTNWVEMAEKMGAWSRIMLHSDMDIPFFNDAAFGIAPSVQERCDYASALGINAPADPQDGIHSLKASGYCRLQQGDFVVLADVAAVGPTYQPGHAHADTLSFEMSWRGQRVFVNSGTSCYGCGVQRSYERSTPAHNTVCINGQDSSEVWGGFRVARRAQVQNVQTSTSTAAEAQQEGPVLCLSASHDGYCRLPGSPQHHRDWRLSNNKLVVSDHILSKAEWGVAVARLQLAPSVRVESLGSHRVVLHIEGAGSLEVSAKGATITLEASKYAHHFGTLQPTTTLCFQIEGAELVTHITALD